MQHHDPHPEPPYGAFAGVPAQAGTPALHWMHTGLLMACVVLLASLFGVWSRLAGQLAVFWPANALLVGLLLRFPRLDTAAGWLGATVGYLLAGWIAGDEPLALVMLTLANFVSVVAGYLMLARLSLQQRQLGDPGAVLLLMWIVLLASACAGLAGAAVGPLLFGTPPLRSAQAWFVSEVVNYITILPAVLTFPARWAPPRPRLHRAGRSRLSTALPLLSLLVALALAVAVGGPGAIAFPVPALLWCGMRYGLFLTSVLTFLTTGWTLLVIAKGVLDLSVNIASSPVLMSIRLGVTLIALSPIAVASAMAARSTLTRRLRHMAEHDVLTGTMNRRAFAERAGHALRDARDEGAPAGLLIVDIDRFKAVNDSYGHAAGDLVIVHIVDCLRRQLAAPTELLGRLGGEEFAVLLPGHTRAQTLQTAERMRLACAETTVDIGAGHRITATVSIGACVADPATERLDALLQCADQALYEAKREGRDRVALGHWSD